MVRKRPTVQPDIKKITYL